jgi:succinate dehydrogenase/fumarate reductase flavoprotein subunit
MQAETDLIVVGFGAAGAAAALTAASLGARVTILEKQDRDAHTPSLRMSGGIVMGANDAAKAATYIDLCAKGAVPADVSAAWAARAVKLKDWHAEMGVDVPMQVIGGAEHPGLAGAESIEVFRQALLTDGTRAPEPKELLPAAAAMGADPSITDRIRSGNDYYFSLRSVVEARDRITINWNTPAAELLAGPDDRVVGVRTAQGEEFRASNGVVLCSGGFEFDDEMRRDFLPAPEAYFYGNPGNTGDGIRMAQQVGAGLWHMNQMFGRAMMRLQIPGGDWMNFHLNLGPPGYVLTDQSGERFADEEEQALHRHDFYLQLLAYDSERRDFPRIPCFWFFDEVRRTSGPLTVKRAGAYSVGLYNWSEENTTEIANGWIEQADSIEEVAALAGVEDPEQAAKTVADYNAACASGSDRFRKNAATLVPLDNPPYYCVPMYPGGSNTSGGPKRDRFARVLDWFNSPIDGLYAAGELGQATGTLYPADGSNLSEALCFGAIAAESAVMGTEE